MLARSLHSGLADSFGIREKVGEQMGEQISLLTSQIKPLRAHQIIQ
jgi:ribosomal protein S15P/S13E